MDLGVDKLIEMLEERFGRPAATGLLALLALGVASWAVHEIFVSVLLPIVSWLSPFIAKISGVEIAITLPGFYYSLTDPLNAFMAALGVLTGGWLIFSYARFRRALRRNPEINQLIADAAEAQNKVARAVDDSNKKKKVELLP